jgi:hypothetical protein
MAEDAVKTDMAVRELIEIKSLLQTLIIIEGARGGMSRDQVRELIGVKTQRVSDIWGKIKNKKEQ